MIRKIYRHIKNFINTLGCYVIADPNDNSITLSKRLFKHIQKHHKNNIVMGVKIKNKNKYAFIVDPDIKEQTQTAQIQHNDKHKTIGFETLTPAVGRIFYDYQLPPHKPQRLSITIKQLPTNNKYYYIIERY